MLSCFSCVQLFDPIDCSLPVSFVHWILQARMLEWVAFPFSRGDLPTPGIEPRYPTLQVDSLPAEPPGKSKNTAVGSLFLLQRIFPIQESNQGLLHCRQILYQLSYEGQLLMVIFKASSKYRKFRSGLGLQGVFYFLGGYGAPIGLP